MVLLIIPCCYYIFCIFYTILYDFLIIFCSIGKQNWCACDGVVEVPPAFPVVGGGKGQPRGNPHLRQLVKFFGEIT